jgi:glycosyltransferase involved in cell wall biosynthesis
MKQPTVTAIIPCFNSGRYIYEAVESVKMQRGNFTLTDIIIVDDGSDDAETREAFNELRKDPDVRIFPNRYSKGPAGARNTGIALVDSQWIAFLDADDILTPNSIATRIDALCSSPGTKWCGGDFVKFYPDGSYEIDPIYRSGQKYSLAFEGYAFDKPLLLERPVKYFLKKMITWMGAVLIRTDVLKDCSGFNEALFQSEDNNLFIRIALNHAFLFVPDVVLAKREHNDSLTRQKWPPNHWTTKNFRSLLKDPAFKPYDRFIRRRLKHQYRINYEFHLKHRQYLRYLKNRAWHTYFKASKHLNSS